MRIKRKVKKPITERWWTSVNGKNTGEFHDEIVDYEWVEEVVENSVPEWMRPWTIIPQKLIKDSTINVYEKLVLIYLIMSLGNESRIAFPSEVLMAKNLKVSRSTILRAVKSLRQRGLIEIQREKSQGARFEHNTYQVNGLKIGEVLPF